MGNVENSKKAYAIALKADPGAREGCVCVDVCVCVCVGVGVCCVGVGASVWVCFRLIRVCAAEICEREVDLSERGRLRVREEVDVYVCVSTRSRRPR